MISKRISSRKDGESSATAALKYGAGLKIDRKTGEYLDKSHRTRLGGFGLIEDNIYVDKPAEVMLGIIELAAVEMQANCDLNSKVGLNNKIAHFVFSFNQCIPTEAVLRDVEDSTLAALSLNKNHFGSFLHNDNGHWHLHIFASRIDKNKHLGNSLWRDKILRDKVCREVELRHGLARDNGLHEINDEGQIIEVPRQERQARREEKMNENSTDISGGAKKLERHTGEKSFQTWSNEIRIGDRLKYAKSWQDLHAIASTYSCVIKQKGAGFVVCPTGENGSLQLSKVGLKNLPAKFGQFQVASSCQKTSKPQTQYKSAPTKPSGEMYKQWQYVIAQHKSTKVKAFAEFREEKSIERQKLVNLQKLNLTKIRSTTIGFVRTTAISIAKMEHAVLLSQLAEKVRAERAALYKNICSTNPGATFRDYLQQQAQAGDDAALVLSRLYSMDEATKVSIQTEAEKLKIVATIMGVGNKPALRLPIKYRVERNGTIIFDLGLGRTIVDSAITKQIQLNALAANDPEAIETSLRFAAAKFGNPLTLYGTPEFQRLAVETAVSKGLFIKFIDPKLEQYRQELTTKIFQKEQQNVRSISTNQYRRVPSSETGDSMRSVSKRNLDADQEKSTSLLLPENVSNVLGEQHSRIKDDRKLRRVGPKRGERSATSSDALVADTRVGSNSSARTTAREVIIVDTDTTKKAGPSIKQTVEANRAQLAIKANATNEQKRNAKGR
jgi:hypothetical protein